MESRIQGWKGLSQVGVKTWVVRPQAHTLPASGVGSGPHHLTFSWDTGSRASRLSLSSKLLGWAVLCKEMASGMSPPVVWGQILSRNQSI